MSKSIQRALVPGAMATTALVALLTAQQPQQTPPATPAQPQITLAPGLNPVPDYTKTVADPPLAAIPAGFTPIFNGKDLSGWHISKTARHGLTPDFHVAHGMILGTQRPLGSGGLLLTDKRYRNFELSMDVKPDWGCDSGVFFRATESSAAYQITMDYLQGGSMGRMIGEGGIQGVGRAAGVGAAAGRPTGARATSPATPALTAAAAAPQGNGRGAPTQDPGMNAWKREDWNTVRVRVVGDIPHVTVWINDQQISDATDTANHAIDGMVEGPIAIQIHGGPVRWQPGGFWRWRNIAIRELPN